MVKTKKLKLLVTGAAGFLGYEVSRQLSTGGYRPRLMYRSRGEDCEICKLDADMVLANLREPKSLQEAVNGVDGIIHLGARATFESYETLKPSIMDGSMALMEEGIKAGVRLFVYSSSLLVYSGRASIITADSQPNPAIDYGRIKADTEKRLSEMAATAGICFASLRLPHIYGVRDLYFRQLQAGRLILQAVSFCQVLEKTSTPTFTSMMQQLQLSPVRSRIIRVFCHLAINFHPPGLRFKKLPRSTIRNPAFYCCRNGWPSYPWFCCHPSKIFFHTLA
jgi:nucleoside-diphosphate-sugar epimerase